MVTSDEHEDCYEICKKLVKNFEDAKSGNKTVFSAGPNS